MRFNPAGRHRVRGQRLFVRPLDLDDRFAIEAFLARYAPASPVPHSGLLGKLVGELVAVLAIEITESAMRIDDLVVATDLRRKRVGRAMIDQAAELAAKMGRVALIVEQCANHPATFGEFLRRVGFERDGSRMIRVVEWSAGSAEEDG